MFPETIFEILSPRPVMIYFVDRGTSMFQAEIYPVDFLAQEDFPRRSSSPGKLPELIFEILIPKPLGTFESPAKIYPVDVPVPEHFPRRLSSPGRSPEEIFDILITQAKVYPVELPRGYQGIKIY